MAWFLFPIFLIPAAATGWIWYSRRPNGAAWLPYLRRIGFLFGVGLFVASPFLCRQGLGTSESYNYSLSAADAITQFRSGVFPVLVGQSEYAFNGRIHPLRTAPWIDYFAILIDLITGHHLNFWAVQNLTLALSLIGAVFSAYASLRMATNVSPRLAGWLAAAYILSPGLLAATYGMDLYMTVMTAPFLPIIFSASVRALNGETRFRVYAILGSSLAACWLAHPPVALWTTVGVAILQLPVVATRRFWQQSWLNAFGGLIIFLVLANFVFVSALTIQSYQQTSAARETLSTVTEVQRVFADSLRPVSKDPDQLGDFQLGYVFWLLLIGGTITAVYKKHYTAFVLLIVIALYLSLTTPIPWFNPWLWAHVPAVAGKMTSIWPMQRLYLLITVTLIFMVATQSRPQSQSILQKLPRFLRDLVYVGFAIAGGWTVLQASHFIQRGFNTRQAVAQSAKVHFPENLNPTAISYAFVGTPPSFVNGVMDPRMEFSLYKRGTFDFITNNWLDPASELPATQRGSLEPATGSGTFLFLSPKLTLQPSSRYRLDLGFNLQQLDAVLQITGANTFREYQLPSAGGPKGFGMGSENLHSITLWTTGNKPEEISLQLVGPNFGEQTNLNFASFALHPLDLHKLPIDVQGWVPLTAQVRTPEPAYLETPRMFINGYRAVVNETEVRTQASPNHLVMFPVPSGASSIKLWYEGPLAVRASFWSSFWGWTIFMMSGCAVIFRDQRKSVTHRPQSTYAWRLLIIQNRKTIGLTIAVLLAVGLIAGTCIFYLGHREVNGPIEIKLVFPQDKIGRSQPVLTTGKWGAGTFIFARFVDPTHIRLGIDNWGEGWLSEPIPVDYYAEQDFVIDSAALYPKTPRVGDPRFERLKNHITVTLNGSLVLDRPLTAYPSKASEITVGESRIGGSNTDAKFTGQILKVRRLPFD